MFNKTAPFFDSMQTFTFIVNPLSGGKKKDGTVRLIRELFPGAEILFTEYAGHAEELSRASESDVVVAVGGDGTVNEVARGLVHSGKALGIIPCGSGDGLALHLGISRRHRKALRQLKSGIVVSADSAELSGNSESHRFFCTCGVGLDAHVGMEFSHGKTRGLLGYILLSAREWFRFRPDTYILYIDGKKAFEGPAVFITVGNAGQWGNNARICPEASLKDGLLDVTVVKPFGTWMFPGLLLRLVSGRVRGASRTELFRGAHVVIERSKDGPAHYDGEPVQMGKRLEAGIDPSSINIVVPVTRYEY